MIRSFALFGRRWTVIIHSLSAAQYARNRAVFLDVVGGRKVDCYECEAVVDANECRMLPVAHAFCRVCAERLLERRDVPTPELSAVR